MVSVPQTPTKREGEILVRFIVLGWGWLFLARKWTVDSGVSDLCIDMVKNWVELTFNLLRVNYCYYVFSVCDDHLCCI